MYSPTDFVPHEQAEFAIEELDAGRHVLLVGDKGSAKSMFGHYYAQMRSRELNILDCDAHLDADDVLGCDRAQDGKFAFQLGAVPDAAMHGKIALINEFTTLKGGVAHVIHSSANYEPIPIRTKSGTSIISPHPNYRIIATANGSAYDGNYRLAQSTTDRFTVIPWPALEADAELELLAKTAPTHAGVLRDLVELAGLSRKNADHPSISTRTLVTVAMMLDSGQSLERAVFHKILYPGYMNESHNYAPFFTFVTGTVKGLDLVELSRLNNLSGIAP